LKESCNTTIPNIFITIPYPVLDTHHKETISPKPIQEIPILIIMKPISHSLIQNIPDTVEKPTLRARGEERRSGVIDLIAVR